MSSHFVPRAVEIRAAGLRLLAIADEIESDNSSPQERIEKRNSQYRLAEVAVTLYTFRRKRERYLKSSIIGEPGWDILLDLFIMNSTGRDVAVKCVCIASGVPPTTALRYISALEAEGLIERKVNPADKRICNIGLSSRGRQMMADLLAQYDVSN